MVGVNLSIIPKILWRLLELKRNDLRPLDDTLANRDTAVRRLLEFARAASPFYAQFHRGLDGAPLNDLPILTKATMMEQFDELVTDRTILRADVARHLDQLPAMPLFRGRYLVCSTSGSTGHPGFFIFDRNEWATAIASFGRAASWSRVAVSHLFGRMVAISSTVPWHMSTQAGTYPRLPGLPLTRFDAAEAVETLVRRLNALRPRMIMTYPSVGRELAMEQLEGRLAIEPRIVFIGSEVLTPAVRGLMEQAWGPGCVFDQYGATETGCIAAECPKHRLHLAEDLAVVEGVDRENRPVPPGVASEKLLVTVLFRRTQPLIRYEISDRVVFSAHGCDCGLPWRVIDRVEGRVEELLALPTAEGGTRLVNPVVFEGVLDGLPIAGWQVTSNGRDVTVLLAGADRISADTVRERILGELSRYGIAPASVEVRRVRELSRTATGKVTPVKMTD